MENSTKSNKERNWGGKRPGQGRPKGSGHKIRLEDLLDSIEKATKMPYAERLALNYAGAIVREDWTKVEIYDRAFLNKVVADKQEIEITDSSETVVNKEAAFLKAIELIQTVGKGK
jgi:hypothetical protein